MLTKTICTLALLASSLSAHAATQTFEFKYSNPDWYGPLAGSFSADDVNGDNVFSKSELTSFRLDQQDWFQCRSWQTCEIAEFSYQPGGKVELEASWRDNDGTRSAWYQLPGDYYAKYQVLSYCDGQGGCYYNEDIFYYTAKTTFSITNTTPVPEPQAWLMLGAGLAVLGGAARRRRHGAALTA